jgi:hypothetical protein
MILDDTEGSGNLKPLSDFDVAFNGRFICGGTELIDDDAFLLFWDVRSTNLLGGYWESHTDDITQVGCSYCMTYLYYDIHCLQLAELSKAQTLQCKSLEQF